MNNWRLWIILFILVSKSHNCQSYFSEAPKGFQQVVYAKENAIKLRWDHEHYYYGYNLFWWKPGLNDWKKIFIDHQDLIKRRIKVWGYHPAYEVFEFHDDNDKELVYYFQLSGWLYGNKDGNKTNVLKALKEYKGQQYPVEGLRQEPSHQNGSITISWKRSERSVCYQCTYSLKYHSRLLNYTKSILMNETSRLQRTVNSSVFTFYPDVNDSIYNVWIYLSILSSSSRYDPILTAVSEKQASNIQAYRGYIGQPPHPEQLEQLHSRNETSVTLRWKAIKNIMVNSYKVKIVESSSVVVRNFSRKSSTDGYVYAELTDLKAGQNYQFRVFACNEHGDGFQSVLTARVNQSIYKGQPERPKDFSPWSPHWRSTEVIVRWKVVMEGGYSPLLGYEITYWTDAGCRVNGTTPPTATTKLLLNNVVDKSYVMYRFEKVFVYYRIRNLYAGCLYRIVVCAYNRYGCGKPTDVLKLKPGRNESTWIGAPRDLVQLPKGNPSQVIVRWRTPLYNKTADLALLGFVILTTFRWQTYRDTIEVHSTSSEYYTFIFHTSRTNQYLTTGSDRFTIRVFGFSLYRSGEKAEIKVTAGYVGLSAPKDLEVVANERHALTLRWRPLPFYQKSRYSFQGYCLAYSKRKSDTWDRCCLNLTMSLSQDDDFFILKLNRQPNGRVHSSTQCWTIEEGYEFFKVFAYNSYGVGPYSHTLEIKAFQDSVLTATTDHHKTIIISCVSLSVVMLLCILLLWFKRRKIPCFRQCVSLQQQPGVVVRAQRTRANDINAWTLNFLPSYEEAEATKPTCSPPTFEETLEFDEMRLLSPQEELPQETPRYDEIT